MKLNKNSVQTELPLCRSPALNSLCLLLLTLDSKVSYPPPDMSTPSSGEWTDSRSLARQRFSSPLIEVVLCVVQPQAHSHRVALPALSENVVHSGVPVLRPGTREALGDCRKAETRG